jgi:hypothetical protein
MHCGSCDNIPFWRWLKLNQKFTTSITCNDYDGEKLSNLKYNQIILLVTVVSICALFSYQMHCWIPVMCHRAQMHSADPRTSGSRNPLNERVVNTERGPLWLTWFYIPVEDHCS